MRNKGFKINFYEDMPYATRYPFKNSFVKKLRLKPMLLDITDFIDKKIKLLKVYKSHLYEDFHIIPSREYAFKFKSGKACERVWK